MFFLNYLMYFEYLKKTKQNYEVEEEVESNRKTDKNNKT